MPSSHHFENQKMRDERKEIRKCRGDSNKKQSGNRKHRCKNSKSGSGRNKNSHYEANFRKFPQHKDCSSGTRYKDSQREFTNDFPSPPTVRSPWASPQRPRPRSLWFRSPSPVRLDQQEYHKSAKSQSPPEVKGNSNNESSNAHVDYYDSDSESGYVYEKIEGWDTDTDDEEALPQKC